MMAILIKEKDGSIQYPRPLLLLGDASYSIYLVHAPCMLITAEVLNKTGMLTTLPSTVMFFLITIFSILISVIFYDFIEKRIMILLKKGKNVVTKPLS